MRVITGARLGNRPIGEGGVVADCQVENAGPMQTYKNESYYENEQTIRDENDTGAGFNSAAGR
jgi:hypothetical protein